MGPARLLRLIRSKLTAIRKDESPFHHILKSKFYLPFQDTNLAIK